jgi:enoyl-CoA hydratase/carnithine racemase
MQWCEDAIVSNRVNIETSDHIATVTLNRAEKRNAVDIEMFAGLREAGKRLQKDRSVRAVILCAAGEHFCAGIDVSVFQGDGISAVGKDSMEPARDSLANFFQSAAYVWREVPVPVIAALRGSVFGAGLQIAMGADIRYASHDVQMSVMEIKWGLIPDMAISTTIRHVVALDKVRELVYTGRIVEAEEALRIGLVTALRDDPLAAARATAEEIAGRSPDAIRAGKKLLNEAWGEAPAMALRQEAKLQLALMAGENQKEAVLANLERRPPRFTAPKA